MLDLPGIIEGAAYGKGRGRQVVMCAKTADLILIVLDAGKEGTQLNHQSILERELYLCGIRLNKSPPRIAYTKKKTGGIKVNATCKLTKHPACLHGSCCLGATHSRRAGESTFAGTTPWDPNRQNGSLS